MEAVRNNSRSTLTEIVHETGLPRTTVHRFLENLVEIRWLSRVGNRYEFGIRMLEMGAREEHWFYRLAEPELYELHLRTRQVVHLSFLDGTDVLFWKKLAGRAGRAVPTRVGGRRPAHLTASGKAILAAGGQELVQRVAAAGLSPATASSIADEESLADALQQVRTAGIAHDDGESWPEIGCLAVAVVVRDGGATTVGTPMIAAISVSGPRHLIHDTPGLASALRAAGAAIQSAASLAAHQAYDL